MIGLQELVGSFKFFVETSSLLHAESDGFFRNTLQPALANHHAKIIVPQEVIKEVDRLQQHRQEETRSAARRGALILQDYIRAGLVDVRGEPGERFPEGVFQHVFAKYRTQYNLALLTQNSSLANDVLAIAHSQPAGFQTRLAVLRLNRSGELRPWRDGPLDTRQDTRRPSERDEERRFAVCTQPVLGSGTHLRADVIPCVGDFVRTQRSGSVRLCQELGKGGEGKIFLTDKGEVCKVYNRDRITDHKLHKLELMMSKPVSVTGVCWPLDLAMNTHGQFVGYMMPLAPGAPLQKSVFVKPLLKRKFPTWTRQHLVQLGITILQKCIQLHDRNVLIGDLNPMNIMVESEERVFFVDTDSYQIEKYPCPVGMVNFTAPDIQGQDFRLFLRTLNHEHFAIATLLFMILLPGKPPYSHQGGETPGANIRKGQFPYPLGERTSKGAPDGPWRFIWSNLPYALKEVFYNCFQNDVRPAVSDWLHLMHKYSGALRHGHVTDELFPTYFKPVSQHARTEYGASPDTQVQLTCDECGNDFYVRRGREPDTHKNSPTLCHDCRQLRKTKREAAKPRTCQSCGHSFFFSVAEEEAYEARGFSPPKFCKACRDERKRKRENGQTLYCSECGRSFFFSLEEEEFYQKKGYGRPRRCPICRKWRKRPKWFKIDFNKLFRS